MICLYDVVISVSSVSTARVHALVFSGHSLLALQFKLLISPLGH